MQVNILDIKIKMLELERMLLVHEMPSREFLNRLVKEYFLVSDYNEEVYIYSEIALEKNYHVLITG